VGVGDGSTTLDLSLSAGGTIVRANGINVTSSTQANGSFTFLTAIPEPTTALLIGSGVLVATLFAPRRRRTAR
jgi:hypothetical protein